jgi:hypothetical protein
MVYKKRVIGKSVWTSACLTFETRYRISIEIFIRDNFSCRDSFSLGRGSQIYFLCSSDLSLAMSWTTKTCYKMQIKSKLYNFYLNLCSVNSFEIMKYALSFITNFDELIQLNSN